MNLPFSPPSEEKVQKVFQRVAKRYDLANDVLSVGIHRFWKSKLIRRLTLPPKSVILDCATGTGDLAFLWKKRAGPDSEVIGTDFNPEMLAVAQKRNQDKEKAMQPKFALADVTQLPFEANTFDVCSISFGIRNVAKPLQGLAELHRVLKPGGTLFVLEFGQPKGILQKPYSLYSRFVLPKIGGALTRAQDAYEYLEESSSQFPCGEEFLQWLDHAGSWSNRNAEQLSLGIAYLYQSKKA